MRIHLLPPALALALAAAPAPAQLADQLPERAIIAAGGVRDAGDLGVTGFGTVGARFQTAPRHAWVVSATYTSRGDQQCPADLGTSCVPGSASVMAFDIGVEFLYGQFAVQPYGVVSLGVARLRRGHDELHRIGPVYSTGLGVSVPLTEAVRLFAEGRWRQETFGSINTRGYSGLGGVRFRL